MLVVFAHGDLRWPVRPRLPLQQRRPAARVAERRPATSARCARRPARSSRFDETNGTVELKTKTGASRPAGGEERRAHAQGHVEDHAQGRRRSPSRPRPRRSPSRDRASPSTERDETRRDSMGASGGTTDRHGHRPGHPHRDGALAAGGTVPTPLPGHPFSGHDHLRRRRRRHDRRAGRGGRSAPWPRTTHRTCRCRPGRPSSDAAQQQGHGQQGSTTVTIDGKAAARLGDPVRTCNDPTDADTSAITSGSGTVTIG